MNEIAPPGNRPLPAPRIGWWALLLAVCGLTGLELVWRARGMEPSVDDSPTLWAVHRTAVPAGDPRAVVLLGGSRLHCAFDCDLFRERHPGRPLRHLAVDGLGSNGVLKHFADDPTFRGLAIVDTTESNLLDDPAFSAAYVDRADAGVSATVRLEEGLRARLEDRLVVGGRHTTWRRLLGRLAAGRGLPADTIPRMGPDRDQPCFYLRDGVPRAAVAGARATNEAAQRAKLAAPRPAPARFPAEVARVVGWTRAIAGRGGRVLFVRVPTGGAYAAFTGAFYPRAACWDPFAARIAAIPGCGAVHYEDVPVLAALELPDASHIDAADRPAFTAAVLAEVDRRGLLDPAADRSAAGRPAGRAYRGLARRP